MANSSPLNEAPVFTSSTTATVNENQTAADTAVATDSDGDALTYSLDGSDALLQYILKPINRAFQGALSER